MIQCDVQHLYFVVHVNEKYYSNHLNKQNCITCYLLLLHSPDSGTVAALPSIPPWKYPFWRRPCEELMWVAKLEPELHIQLVWTG